MPPRGIDTTGNRLSRWRRRAKWTQSRLAREAGVELQTISRIERAETGTQLVTANAILEALGRALGRPLRFAQVFPNHRREEAS